MKEIEKLIMDKELILVDPNYQNGFEGFLRACDEDGLIVVIGENKFDFGLNISSSSEFLRKLLGRSALWLPSYKKLKKIIISNNIDRIHVVGEPTYFSVLICCLIKYFSRKEMRITCRAAQNLEFRLPFIFKFVLWFSRLNNVETFPVSNLSKSFSESFYKLKTLNVLPNGVPELFYNKKLKETNRNTVLFIGHFIERKGFSDFLKAAEYLGEKYSDINFLAVGGRADLVDMSSFEKLYPSIKFMSWMDRESLIDHLDSSVCLVMPSKKSDGKDVPLIKRLVSVPWSEQFGRVIIEAYARSTPVIAYDSGAISEVVISSDNLVPEGDIQCLTDKIEKAISLYKFDPKLREYSEGYRWQSVYQNYFKGK